MEPETSLLADVIAWVLTFGVPLGLLLVAAALAVSLWRTLRATALLFAGDYPGARVVWERKVGSWLPGMDASARYNVAYCLHHEGRLDEALTQLRALGARRPGGLIAGLTDALTGGTLVLLERSPDEADARIAKGYRVFPMRQGPLLCAHAALALGEKDRAAALVAEADAMPDPPSFRLGFIMARVDQPLAAATDAYLRGWYHERVGALDRAREDYVCAAAAPRESVYVHRARAAIERLAHAAPSVASDDPPSSLSPLALP